MSCCCCHRRHCCCLNSLLGACSPQGAATWERGCGSALWQDWEIGLDCCPVAINLCICMRLLLSTLCIRKLSLLSLPFVVPFVCLLLSQLECALVLALLLLLLLLLPAPDPAASGSPAATPPSACSCCCSSSCLLLLLPAPACSCLLLLLLLLPVSAPLEVVSHCWLFLLIRISCLITLPSVLFSALFCFMLFFFLLPHSAYT